MLPHVNCESTSPWLAGGITLGSEPDSDTHQVRTELVYVDTHSDLTSFADGVIESDAVANKMLHELLSAMEWRRVKSITREDLENCQLAYLELGAIISMFLDDPFGDVTLETKAWLSPMLGIQKGAVAWRHCDSNWVTGCLLQRSTVPTRKLVNFCVHTLHYMPVVRNVTLECLKKRPRFRDYRIRAPVANAGKVLLEITQRLSGSFTVVEFGQLMAAAASSRKGFLDPLDSRLLPNGEPVDETSLPIIYRRDELRLTKCGKARARLLSESDAKAKTWNLLGGNLTKLNGMGPEDLKSCSLAYFELGSIAEQYIHGAFGTVCLPALRQVSGVMCRGSGTVQVRGWVAGCILQYARVPISALVRFCVLDLNYEPPKGPLLECLRSQTDRYRARRLKQESNYLTELTARVSALTEKISIPEYVALITNKQRALNYVVKRLAPVAAHETHSSPHLSDYSPQLSDYSPQLSDSPPQTVPTLSTNLITATKRTTDRNELEKSKRKKPSVDLARSTVEGASGLMYCHPNDMIEFLNWVESGMYESSPQAVCSS
ncbi:hypothetical protein GNI_073060 [Gregarina niphandrodes]|uniref:Uncharacterized protein n=1 Tax=Gregarina niphandrodes TaxID=110365 RepID=A0A023B734_GRENI|nr:hypothetical protein GNI_073060 [Gregarina niphandrodes]EZG66998.1 hypothetical protein GNI_073060 [Gregarina niphandrodes]|eukprot:XP_011130385.1 hypothetical protein GNI_073060 [Gregarina niphandrodes]